MLENLCLKIILYFMFQLIGKADTFPASIFRGRGGGELAILPPLHHFFGTVGGKSTVFTPQNPSFWRGGGF